MRGGKTVAGALAAALTMTTRNSAPPRWLRATTKPADIGATLARAIAGQGPAASPGDTHDDRTEIAAELARALANHLAVRAAGAGGAGTDDGVGTGRVGTEGLDLTPVDATATAARRLDEAVRTAATDPTAASTRLRRPTTEPLDKRTNAQALADALGVPELGEELVTIAEAPTGDPTDPARITAHRAAYAIAAAWLG